MKYHKENLAEERKKPKGTHDNLSKPMKISVTLGLADRVTELAKEKGVPVARLCGKMIFKFMEEYQESKDKDAFLNIFPEPTPDYDDPPLEDLKKVIKFLKGFNGAGVHIDFFYMSHEQMQLSVKTCSDCLSKLILMEIVEIKQTIPQWSKRINKEVPPEPRIMLTEEFKTYDKESNKGV